MVALRVGGGLNSYIIKYSGGPGGHKRQSTKTVEYTLYGLRFSIELRAELKLGSEIYYIVFLYSRTSFKRLRDCEVALLGVSNLHQR